MLRGSTQPLDGSNMKEKHQSSFFGVSSPESMIDAKGTLELDTSIDLQADLECYRLQVQQDMKDTVCLMKYTLPMHLVLAMIGAALFWTVALRYAHSFCPAVRSSLANRAS